MGFNLGFKGLTATCNTTSEGWCYRVYDSWDNCSHSF